MSELPLSNPAQMLAIYGGLCGLLYVETDGFRREAPLLNAVPTLTLALLTLTLRMKRPTKQLTASSFVVLALGVYLYSARRHNNLHIACAIFTVAHILYILSFVSCLRRLWHGCAIMVTTYVMGFLYFCFADLFRSIPTLVLSLSVHVIAVAVSLVLAGSVWQFGSKRVDAHQAALFRFLGLLSCLVCSSLLVLNQFGHRIDKSNFACNLAFYIAQPLLFFANERAF